MNSIIENWELILGGVGTFIGFITGKKTKELDETKSMQGVYATFVKDSNNKYQELREEFKELKKDNESNRKLIFELQRQNTELVRELKEWELKYTKLKADFDKYQNN